MLLSLSLMPPDPAAAAFGGCAIPINAPPAVEKALDGVLQQALGSNMATAPAEVRKLLGEQIGAAPGAVISVRAPGWRYVKSAGLADPTAGTSMDCAMPFEIGSNTKMMTAVVLLQLQEEGKLSLDDPLSRHLPEIAARLPNGKDMTLRALAQHTSGVFDYGDDAADGAPGLLAGRMKDPQALRRQVSPQEIIDFVIDHGTPLFPPDRPRAWSYSNTGYVMLGMVIEKKEGRPLADSLKARIFDPLGMTHSFLWNAIPERDFGLPKSYLQPPFTYETTDWNLSQGWAAGGVISTVDDMHSFIEALFAGRLFKSARTLAMMKETVPVTSPAYLGYGIGLKEMARDFWGHGGQTLGYLSIAGEYNDQDISVVAWGNSSGNILGLGDMMITDALRRSGVLADK